MSLTPSCSAGGTGQQQQQHNLNQQQQQQQAPPPPRRRLQPSEKQLKQSSSSCHPQQQRQQQQRSLGSSSQHHHHHHHHHHQTIMAGLYDLEETLGKGHFATVKAAKHVFTGERVAVKVIDKTKLDTVSQKALLKEVLCMKLVQHPNVVKLYEVIDTGTKMYLVLELGQGDLYDLILRQQGGLPEPQARVYFRQILTAVSYCHKLHVAHRDLKPENVVFFPREQPKKSASSTIPQQQQSSSSSSSAPKSPVLGQVKLTDFGFSNKFCPGVNLDTSCGSLAYSAPEILLGDSYDAPSVDIWSLGVILYMLVCGRAPFQEANDSETLTMIMDVKYSLPDHLSKSLKDLIRRMLVRDPGKRARLHEIEAHPWVREGEHCDVVEEVPLIVSNSLTESERERIFTEMVKGGVVADVEEIRSSLLTNAYNHITSTYYLLAERLLREKARRPASVPQSPTSISSSRQGTPDHHLQPCDNVSPPRIRRKNSHVLEDVVLPSAAAAASQQQRHHHDKPSTQQTNQNIAGLDLETNSLKTKFVCLPVIEPDEHGGGVVVVGGSSSSTSRNSSPHHPHYYHHLGKRISTTTTTTTTESSSSPLKSKSSDQLSQSPPKYCSNTRTRINKSHHSHSDSSDEGGGGNIHHQQQPIVVNTTTVVVTTPTTPEEETQSNDKCTGGGGGGGGRASCSMQLLKPSPSYEGIVDDDDEGGSGSSGGGGNQKRGKKKRVLFLSWFFKRSGGGKVTGNDKKRNNNSGANGIYKTRSCAELKSRGCNDVDLNVRECFGVCNGNQNNLQGSVK